MASVNHPAVASIHDYGRSDGITFLVMEFIDGESLAQALGRSGRLAPAETMRLIAQAADGLQAVHDRGFVHRDIKPANLLIRRNGSLLITDFGISRSQDSTHLTVSGAILGTPTYLSPEQVLGKPATALSDVYSLGLTAYECLAGRRPFAGDNPYAVALQRLQVAPATLTGYVPGPMLAVVERALAVDPADRWPSAAALADAARAAALAPAWAGAQPPPALVPPASWSVPAPAPPASSASLGSVAPASWAPPAPAPAVPVAAPRRSGASAWRWSIVAAVLTFVLVGGFALWRTIGTGGGHKGSQAAESLRPTAAAADAALQQARLAACGAVLCPIEPLCWGGLVAISGNATPPRKVDCAKEHAWETFSAVYLPGAAAGVRQEELMKVADVKTACSALVMASRSSDRSVTKGWVRDAWPVQLPGTGLWILHCIARPDSGVRSGSAFL
jgi:serine/threonine-protein kinase